MFENWEIILFLKQLRPLLGFRLCFNVVIKISAHINSKIQILWGFFRMYWLCSIKYRWVFFLLKLTLKDFIFIDLILLIGIHKLFSFCCRSNLYACPTSILIYIIWKCMELINCLNTFLPRFILILYDRCLKLIKQLLILVGIWLKVSILKFA